MRRLTEGNIWKNFLLFAIPMVLSGLLSQAYSTIDTMIAGHYLEETGLAAIGATSSVITFVSSLLSGYLVGFGMYIARLFGEGAYNRLRRGVWMNLGLCALVSILISAFAIFFADELMELLKVEYALREEAKKYFVIYTLGFCIFHVNAGAVFMLGSLGDTSFSFYMSVLSSVLNIGGNIFAVAVLKQGVAGIAWASVLSAAVTTVFFLLRFRRIFKKLLPDEKPLKWSFQEVKIAVPYSIPPVFQQAALYAVGLLLSPMINSLGESAIASYVVSTQIMGLVSTMYFNSSRAVSNYTAQCLGTPFETEDKKRRLRKGIGVGLVQSMAFALVMLIPCLLFPEFIASVFFAEGSARESIDLTVFFLRVFLPFALFNVVTNLFHGVFRAVKAKGFLLFSTVFSSAVRIAVSFPLTIAYGLDGFWAGMVIAWIAEVLMLAVVYRMNWWMPKDLRTAKE